MNNIEMFNTIVGLVLADLYESFPSPRSIRAMEYAAKVGVDIDFNTFDPTNDQKFPAIDTMKWLIEEGYIRCKNIPTNVSDFFDRTILTSKGLQLLSLPESLKSQNSIGLEMAEAAKAGSLDGVRDLAKTVICEGGKFLIRTGIDAVLRP